MDLKEIASRVAGRQSGRVAADMDVVKVWVDESTGTFRVEYRGETHSAVMPEDPDEGDIEDLKGDAGILRAATFAWNGEPYFEMSAEEFSKISGGHWAPPVR